MTNVPRWVPPPTMLRWTSAVALLAAFTAGACGGGGDDHGASPSGAGGHAATSTGAGLGSGGGLGIGGMAPQGGPFSDFPPTPILDTPMGGQAPPPNSIDLFGPEGSGDSTGGPCLIDPEPGTLFPNNWLRPRFRFAPGANQNLFEIRIKAPNEVNELVVYTTATEWKMPLAMWQSLASHIPDVPMTVTVRGAELAGGQLMGSPSVGTTGDLRIAPAAASGSIVYWRTMKAANSGVLKGFSVGDESVVTALQTTDVQVKPGGNGVTCLGCHTSTPDGQFAAFKSIGGAPGGALASVVQGSTGAAPKFWSQASIDAMSSGKFGVPSFSKAHWTPGDYTLLTSWGNGSTAQLAWFDLEAKSGAQGQGYGIIARSGDLKGAIMPSFSHDGQRIAYISTTASTDGRPTTAGTDLYTVPYANRQGGAATPIAGAADPAYSEYYPAFSPDDQFIAFNRIAAGKDTYNQPEAEVFVIPSGGGVPTRLAANDPGTCSGQKSPGVTNSWPKWAPEAVVVGDRTFYWLTFSSTRAGGIPQLYVTAMVVQGGKITTYPALYLWNQPEDEPNHTPAWDVFEIPAPPPK